MMKLQVHHCLRLDHKFKVASNIGYQRADGKWITQYSSVFIALNEKGEVVAWQLTNSTSFDEIAPVLVALRDRISDNSQQHITIFVDNCCHVRGKLEGIFSSKTAVKLDVFHAVQRVTRAMSKKHMFFHTCVKDLRMIFRHPTDIGMKRALDTPEPHHMLQNMYNFVAKWRNMQSNGHKILTDKVLEQNFN